MNNELGGGKGTSRKTEGRRGGEGFFDYHFGNLIFGVGIAGNVFSADVPYPLSVNARPVF